MNLNTLIALVRKDLVLYFSNRRALVISVAAPIVIAAFFGYLFGGGSAGSTSRIVVALTDLDHSAISGSIASALKADPALDVRDLGDAEAQALVKAGKASAAVVLPAGFGQKAGQALFGGSDRPEIVITHDPSQGAALQVVRGLLAQHVMLTVSQAVFSGASTAMGDMRTQAAANPALPAERKRDLAAMFESIERVQQPAAAASTAAAPGSAASAPGSAIGLAVPYTTRETESGSRPDRKYNSFSHSFAGMGVQFVLLMGLDLGVGLLAMRRLGLWKRLRAAPLSKAMLLGSRIASCALTAVVLMTIIYAVAIAAFGVRIDGSVPGIIAVVLAFALLTATFGLLIAALGKTPEATRALAILVTLLMVMVGGAWVPSFIFPPWLQQVSLFVPTRWAIDGLDAMTWRGLGFESAVLPVVVMLGFSALFAGVAIRRFDWEE